MNPVSPTSCCLLRLSALGDVTHVVPLVRVLREHWPECALTWIIGPREHRLVSALPDIDFIIFDKRASGATQGLRQALNNRRFDILLQLQTSLRANLLSTLIHARRRIGWDRGRAREGHRWFINETIAEPPPQHQVQGFLAFARHLGIDATQPCWDLPIDAAARATAAEILPGAQPTLLISPCSSHPLRDWAATNYRDVARHAIEQLGLRVIVCGAPSERERHFGATIAQAHPSVIDYVGRDTLPVLLALLERADIVLTPDSGPAHMANALGKPVIGLHAATWSQRSGPYHSLDLCIDHFEEAAQKFRHKRAQQLRWGTRIEVPGVMDLITVDEVLAQLHRAITWQP